MGIIPRGQFELAGLLVVVMGVMGVMGVACGEGPPTGRTMQEVQQGWDDFGPTGAYRIARTGAHVEEMLPAVGALVHYNSIPDGEGGTLDFASCGVTFISPHFAVTAAHCVNNNTQGGAWTDPGEFFVEHPDVSAVSDADARAHGVVEGTQFEDWTTGNSANPPAGYTRTRFLCRALCGAPVAGLNHTRCADYNVVDEDGNAIDNDSIDLAVIECPERASDDWLPVANYSPDVGAEVEAWWFHEYLDLPILPPWCSRSECPDTWERWEHYGRLYCVDPNNPTPSTCTFPHENFHYMWSHTVWPLVSDTNPDGDPATSQNMNVDGIQANHRAVNFGLDLFGGHGQSGSGTFARGGTGLYGPVVTPYPGYPVYPSTEQSTLVGYNVVAIRAEVTSKLAELQKIVDDRDGIYDPSF